MQPVSTRKTTPKARSLRRFGLFHPAPQRNSPGISRASASSLLEPRSAAEARVVRGAVVPTVIVPEEQVTAGVTTGETLHASFTEEGLNPPAGVIVIVD